MKDTIEGKLDISYEDILIRFEGTVVSLSSFLIDYDKKNVIITIEEID